MESLKTSIKSASGLYNAAVTAYVSARANSQITSTRPMPMEAPAFAILTGYELDSPFWQNDMVKHPNDLWIINDDVIRGIDAILDNDRCDEELMRIKLEIRRVGDWHEHEETELMFWESSITDLLHQLKWRPAITAAQQANQARAKAEAQSFVNRVEWTPTTRELPLCDRLEILLGCVSLRFREFQSVTQSWTGPKGLTQAWEAINPTMPFPEEWELAEKCAEYALRQRADSQQLAASEDDAENDDDEWVDDEDEEMELGDAFDQQDGES